MSSRGEILLTEVAPGVTTSATGGDLVELYNTGPSPVNLTGYLLSDLDPTAVETTITAEGSFAPGSLNLPALAAGGFAVVEFTSAPASFLSTNYGLFIRANVSASFLDNTAEQLVLADPGGTVLDSVAWHDNASSGTATSDTWEDLQALTSPTHGYGLSVTPGGRWLGSDSIPNITEYTSWTLNFTPYTAVSTYGRGVLQRKNTGTTFSTGSPDGIDQWQVVKREEATFGNYTSPVPTGSGLSLLKDTGDITRRLYNLESSSHPGRRITLDQDTNEFKIPSNADMTTWRQVVQACLEQQWESAHAQAATLGYEIVEYLDTNTSHVFHLLQEHAAPGDPAYRGQGTVAFDHNTSANRRLVLEVPHPVHDSRTLDEAALAYLQLRPAVLVVAGTHRNNATTVTACDGTFGNGDPYRVSDPCHAMECFFRATHEEVALLTTATVTLQLHGFTTSEDGDVILSTGIQETPPENAFISRLKLRINQQAHYCDDQGNPDLTEAAIYGPDTTSYGATNNVQGRFLNGVPAEQCCTVSATGPASARFLHMEQDGPVRQDPQHIITALLQALEDTGLTAPATLSHIGLE